MNILIATGGSGGHIFPAIETGKALRTRGHKVSFAGVLGAAEGQIKALDFPAFSLAAAGLNDRSLGGLWRFGSIMSKAVLGAFGVVRKISPDKIIGFGGYGSFPVVMAGFMMGCPSLIHEQNVVPGRANAILSKMVKKTAISFEGSRRYLNPAKVVWTGCPCRNSRLTSKTEALTVFGLEGNKKTIVLIGGSQGSQRLNEVFFEFIKEMPASLYQAIHMTGTKEFETYSTRYRAAKMPVKVFPFIQNITDAYAAADIVIARAGAATVTELGLSGIPSVLVPYPFAGNHQKYNAELLAERDAAIIIEQKDLTVASLKEAATRLLMLDLTRQAVLEKTRGLFQTDAALQLALVTEGL